MSITIRDAVASDLERLTEIYNHAVIHTTATFDLEERTVADRRSWMERFDGVRYPLLVAEENDGVIGYAGLSPYSHKPAYARTVESSIYVDPTVQGNGVGTKLMETLLRRGRAAGHHVVLAGITAGNEGSIRLHERFGFQSVGCLRQVGWKFGQWQDVYFYQLILTD